LAQLYKDQFFVGIHLGLPGLELLCVVTNKHIVEDGSATVRVNTPDDKFDIIALDGAKWYYHPDGDDIAVSPIGFNTTHHKIRSIPSESFLTKKLIEQYDVGVGDDIFVVGRFISREGKTRNIPSVRFGAIAQMPAEPIILDGALAQESYLIEARSIPGYSGSPVFLAIPPAPGPAPRVNPNLPEEIKRTYLNCSKWSDTIQREPHNINWDLGFSVSTIATSTTKNWCSIARLAIQFRICTCDPIRG